MFPLQQHVYHYTTSQRAVEHVLQSFTLRMGSFKGLNDPREAKTWPFRLYAQSPETLASFPPDLFSRISEFITSKSLILCCVQDDPTVIEDHEDRMLRSGFGHPRMWAQYGENHKGVCLVLDQQKLHAAIVATLGSDNLFSGPVNYLNTTYGPVAQNGSSAYDLAYVEPLLEHGLGTILEPYIRRFHRDLFFTKHLDWRDEWEYRWVYRSKDGEPVFIPIAQCLEAVILGADCDEVTSDRLIHQCQDHGVPAYRAFWHGWAMSLMPAVAQQGQILSLNGISYNMTIPCSGVFVQAHDQYGQVQPLLIDNEGHVRFIGATSESGDS
ncbi:MAG: DUF2971 domain-containing protein [Herpetosiphonaceae bacterium]|nr:DUF2971 domain-containing protein [Herpetosiphonaceae bacterium]